jgi:CBS domain-containing protein
MNLSPSTVTLSSPVGKIMHHGLLTVPGAASIAEGALEMARQQVHCLLVPLIDGEGWGIFSERDLMDAIAGGDTSIPIGRVAATEVPTIAPEQSVREAAQLMSEHQCTHLIVAAGGTATGVVSALDVATALRAPSMLDR